jgi:uncharacterized protein YndB with AHSA1/START domain
MKAETSRSVQIEVRVKASPETVFSYFTDPEKYRVWKGIAADLDPRPGGRYRVDMVRQNGVRGEYVVVDPPRRLVFTWGWEADVELPRGIKEVPPGSTTVEVVLIPDGDDTIVRLRHSDLPTDGAATAHTWGWNIYLERLRVAAAGGDPGPDPLTSLTPRPGTPPPWET